LDALAGSTRQGARRPCAEGWFGTAIEFDIVVDWPRRRHCPDRIADAVLLVVFERPLLCRYSRLEATGFKRFCCFWVAVFCLT
jgi:hypothetical protein